MTGIAAVVKVAELSKGLIVKDELVFTPIG